jgi:hypothetical protein
MELLPQKCGLVVSGQDGLLPDVTSTSGSSTEGASTTSSIAAAGARVLLQSAATDLASAQKLLTDATTRADMLSEANKILKEQNAQLMNDASLQAKAMADANTRANTAAEMASMSLRTAETSLAEAQREVKLVQASHQALLLEKIQLSIEVEQATRAAAAASVKESLAADTALEKGAELQTTQKLLSDATEREAALKYETSCLKEEKAMLLGQVNMHNLAMKKASTRLRAVEKNLEVAKKEVSSVQAANQGLWLEKRRLAIEVEQTRVTAASTSTAATDTAAAMAAQEELLQAAYSKLVAANALVENAAEDARMHWSAILLRLSGEHATTMEALQRQHRADLEELHQDMLQMNIKVDEMLPADEERSRSDPADEASGEEATPPAQDAPEGEHAEGDGDALAETVAVEEDEVYLILACEILLQPNSPLLDDHPIFTSRPLRLSTMSDRFSVVCDNVH